MVQQLHQSQSSFVGSKLHSSPSTKSFGSLPSTFTYSDDSSSSYFHRLKTSTKNGIFSILYAMVDGNVFNSVFVIVSTIIEFIELLSFSFYRDYFEWPKEMRFISYIYSIINRTPLTSYSTFTVFYWISFGLFVAALLNTVFVAYHFHRKNYRYIWPIRTLRICVAGLVTFLAIPLVSLWSISFNCRSGYIIHFPQQVDCYGSSNIIVISLSVVSLVVLLPYAIVTSSTYYEMNPTVKRTFSRMNSRYEVVLLLFKIGLTLLFQLAYKSPLFLSIFLFVSMLTIFILSIILMPYYNHRMNQFRTGLVGVSLWGSFMLLFVVTNTLVNSNRYIIMYVFFAGIIPSFIMGASIIELRKRYLVYRIKQLKIFGMEKWKPFYSSYDYEIVSRYLINIELLQKYHEALLVRKKSNNNLMTGSTCGKKEGDADTEGLDEKEMMELQKSIDLANNIYQCGLMTMPKNATLLKSYCYFLKIYKQDQSSSIIILDRLKALETPSLWDIQFFVYHQEQDRERNNDASGIGAGQKFQDFMVYLEFKRLYSMAMQYHLSTLRHITKFWKITSQKRSSQLSTLSDQSSRITKSQSLANKCFRQLIELHPGSSRILRDYSRFVDDVMNDHQLSAQLLEKATKIEEENSKLNHPPLLNLNGDLDDEMNLIEIERNKEGNDDHIHESSDNSNINTPQSPSSPSGVGGGIDHNKNYGTRDDEVNDGIEMNYISGPTASLSKSISNNNNNQNNPLRRFKSTSSVASFIGHLFMEKSTTNSSSSVRGTGSSTSSSPSLKSENSTSSSEKIQVEKDKFKKETQKREKPIKKLSILLIVATVFFVVLLMGIFTHLRIRLQEQTYGQERLKITGSLVVTASNIALYTRQLQINSKAAIKANYTTATMKAANDTKGTLIRRGIQLINLHQAIYYGEKTITLYDRDHYKLVNGFSVTYGLDTGARIYEEADFNKTRYRIKSGSSLYDFYHSQSIPLEASNSNTNTHISPWDVVFERANNGIKIANQSTMDFWLTADTDPTFIWLVDNTENVGAALDDLFTKWLDNTQQLAITTLFVNIGISVGVFIAIITFTVIFIRPVVNRIVTEKISIIGSFHHIPKQIADSIAQQNSKKLMSLEKEMNNNANNGGGVRTNKSNDSTTPAADQLSDGDDIATSNTLNRVILDSSPISSMTNSPIMGSTPINPSIVDPSLDPTAQQPQLPQTKKGMNRLNLVDAIRDINYMAMISSPGENTNDNTSGPPTPASELSQSPRGSPTPSDDTVNRAAPLSSPFKMKFPSYASLKRLGRAGGDNSAESSPRSQQPGGSHINMKRATKMLKSMKKKVARRLHFKYIIAEVIVALMVLVLLVVSSVQIVKIRTQSQEVFYAEQQSMYIRLIFYYAQEIVYNVEHREKMQQSMLDVVAKMESNYNILKDRRTIGSMSGKNYYYSTRTCLRKISPCLKPGDQFYDIVVQGLDQITLDYFQFARSLATIKSTDSNNNPQINSTLVSYQYIKMQSKEDLYDGTDQYSYRIGQDSVDLVTKCQTTTTALAITMSVITIILYFIFYLPLVRYLQYESKNTVSMLNMIPHELIGDTNINDNNNNNNNNINNQTDHSSHPYP